jgi:hypothetical protein
MHQRRSLHNECRFLKISGCRVSTPRTCVVGEVHFCQPFRAAVFLGICQITVFQPHLWVPCHARPKCGIILSRSANANSLQIIQARVPLCMPILFRCVMHSTRGGGRAPNDHVCSLSNCYLQRLGIMHSYPIGESLPFVRQSCIKGIESLSYLWSIRSSKPR